jgi:hypothetical protein
MIEIDYEKHFEDALEARDAAGWLGTSPAETITNLDTELRATQEALHLFRAFVIANATQWQTGAGDHHHPMWAMIAGLIHLPDIRNGPKWKFIQPTNREDLETLSVE